MVELGIVLCFFVGEFYDVFFEIGECVVVREEVECGVAIDGVVVVGRVFSFF